MSSSNTRNVSALYVDGVEVSQIPSVSPEITAVLQSLGFAKKQENIRAIILLLVIDNKGQTTPSQLVLFREEGKVRMTWVSPLDTAAIEEDGLAKRQLLGGSQQKTTIRQSSGFDAFMNGVRERDRAVELQRRLLETTMFHHHDVIIDGQDAHLFSTAYKRRMRF